MYKMYMEEILESIALNLERLVLRREWSDLVRHKEASSNGCIVTRAHSPPLKRSSQHSMTRFSVLKVGKPLLNSSVAPQC